MTDATANKPDQEIDRDLLITGQVTQPIILDTKPEITLRLFLSMAFAQKMAKPIELGSSYRERVINSLVVLVKEDFSDDIKQELLETLSDQALLSLLGQFGDEYNAAIEQAKSQGRDPFEAFHKIVAEKTKEASRALAEAIAPAISRTIELVVPAAKSLQEGLFAFSQGLKEYLPQIQSTLKAVAERIREVASSPGYISFEASVRGYFIPFHLVDAELVEGSDLEVNIVKMLKNNDYEICLAFVAIVEDSLPASQCDHFQQAVEAFQYGLNAPACYTMVALVETLLVENDIMEKSSIHVYRDVKRFLDTPEMYPDSFSEGVQAYYVLSIIADLLYARVEFDDENDDLTVLNRHPVGHGRSRRVFTESDCLKLISVMYGLCTINFSPKVNDRKSRPTILNSQD